ncbi:MAG: hypothetical protein ACI9F9_003006, partial [Candidatus Paceibacteria bacterium]
QCNCAFMASEMRLRQPRAASWATPRPNRLAQVLVATGATPAGDREDKAANHQANSRRTHNGNRNTEQNSPLLGEHENQEHGYQENGQNQLMALSPPKLTLELHLLRLGVLSIVFHRN